MRLIKALWWRSRQEAPRRAIAQRECAPIGTAHKTRFQKRDELAIDVPRCQPVRILSDERRERNRVASVSYIDQPHASELPPTDIFRARAEARAALLAAGELDLHEAVDAFQATAIRGGLLGQIGQDAVQAIMAEAFGRVR
jgi:hypothetical protein